MNNIIRNRWQIRLAALIIFVLGFGAGVLGVNVYRAWARGLNSNQPNFDQFANRLGLNNDQKPKVQQIFSDTREQLKALRKESEPRVNEIRKQADDHMQQILTPAQWQQFQKMRDEWRQRRGKGPHNDDF